jgi:hypothetical protein
MSPQEELAIIRAKSIAGTATLEDTKRAVLICRQDRFAAASAAATKVAAKVAKATAAVEKAGKRPAKKPLETLDLLKALEEF